MTPLTRLGPMRLTLNSIAHFLTDALCAAVVLPLAASGVEAAAPVYNTLAFTTQCVVGLLTDALRRHEAMAGVALGVVALAALLPLPVFVRIALLGLGNSVFHVAAGTVTLAESGGSAGPLGVFVAPGAVGLAVGGLWPEAVVFLAVAALALALLLALIGGETPREKAVDRVPWLAVAALLVAVAARALGGSAVVFPWKTGVAASLALSLFVFAGKTAGGFLADRLGATRSALLSLPAAALLTAFCAAWPLPALAGQLLLNLTMPVTLWLLYRAMPDSPGLAFGLAASALWPGALAGGLVGSSGGRATLILVSLLLGLAAIVYSERKVEVRI